MILYNDIRSVHLEISTRCNAACPECPRNFRGVDTIDSYPVCDMSIEQAQKIFTSSFLKQINHILINGNYGDFITARDGLEIVEYFKSVNPDLMVEISTNASGRPNIWTRLGELKTRVHFRLDGLKDTHHLYRQYTDFDSIIKNARKFIAAGGYAIWAFIPFAHNEHQIDQARELSKQLGFKEFSIKHTSRFKDDKFDVLDNHNNIIDTLYPTSKSKSMITKVKKAQEEVLPVISCKAKNQSELYVNCFTINLYKKIN